MIETFINNFAELSSHTTTIFALFAVILFIFAFLHFRKVILNTKMLVTISLMLALTILLNQFKLYHMPQGGSITLGSMLPLLFISFRYGPGVGFLAGFLYGIINLLQDPFIMHPVQVLFDYPLPYMALGLAGYFRKHLYIGTAIAITGRFLCHFISGIVFFASYAPAGTSAYMYSFTFNATYLVPDFLICLILLKLLPTKRLLRQMDPSPKNTISF
jgi:thiamine transporter